MTTDKKAENKSTESENKSTEKNTTDNKTVFGPLGKYAVVAVIMVSIIVTTAIMLDKQLNTVSEELAVIEDEVAEMNIASSETVTTEIDETNTAATTEATDIHNNDNVVATVVATNVAPAEAAPVEIKTETAQVTEVISTDTASAEAVTTESNVAAPTQQHQSQVAINNQARIDSHKADQKKRMSEMFTRIRSLEAKQLEHYQINQNKQIAHLREQNVKQQQLIEKLISRNKGLYEMRSANIQRNQENREQILNRI